MTSSAFGSLRYRWVVLAIGTTAQGVLAGLFQAVPVLAPALQIQYDLSLRGVGLLIAAATGGQILTQFAWGLLNDRFGERAVLPVGLGLAGLALVGTALTSRLGVVIVTLILSSMFATAVSAATGRAIMGWFAARQRGLALGIRQAAVPLGGAAVALVLPVALSLGGLSAAFGVLAAACLATAAIGLAGLREPPYSPPTTAGPAFDPLRDRRLRSLTTGSMLLTFVQGAILGFTVLYLHLERGFSTAQAAAVLAAINVMGAVFRLLIGHVSDRSGRRVVPLGRICLGLSVAMLVATAAMDAPDRVFIPLFFVAGCIAVSWNGLLVTATAELAGLARTGAALGFQQTALSIVFSGVGPAFAGVVTLTSWRAGYALLGVLPLGAYLIFRPLSALELAHERLAATRT